MMATYTEFNDDVLSLQCKLCKKIYQHENGPLLLPCLHSFCKPCLLYDIESKKSVAGSHKMSSCPTCNFQFPFCAEFISCLPVNLRLHHLAQEAICKKKFKSGILKCGKCSEKAAQVFCSDCCIFLCNRCQSDHQWFLKDKNHEFIVAQGNELKYHSNRKCSEHQLELNLFCEECELLICVCSQTYHQNHLKNSSSIKTVAKEEKSKFLYSTTGIDGILGQMNGTVLKIQRTRNKLKETEKKVADEIDKACNELIQAIESKRIVLKSKCHKIANGKDNALLHQQKEMEELRKQLSFTVMHVRDAVHNHSPEEILSVSKALRLRLNQVMTASQQQSMELRENSAFQASIDIKSLLLYIENFGFFPDVPDPLQCQVEQSMPVAGIGKEKKIGIAVRDEKKAPVSVQNLFIQYHVKKLEIDVNEHLSVPPQVTIAKPDTSTGGKAIFGFTPNQPGKYEVTVMVKNNPIASPFMITARECREYGNFENMDVSFRNVGGKCCSVAIHDNGTVYATNYSNGTVVAFKPDGSQQSNFNISGPKLSNPMGIILVGDEMYIACAGTSTIRKYSATNGRFRAEFGGKGSQEGKFKDPYGICSDGKGNIVVADTKNYRIQIFTPQGNFIRSFTCSNYPYDFAVDELGNIHAALYKEHHIAVYSESGKKIKTYNLGGKLQYPTGICIDGVGYRVISTDSNLISTDSNQVHIIDSEGIHVASREVKDARGVAMDKNGIIYIAEYGNSRLSVFS